MVENGRFRDLRKSTGQENCYPKKSLKYLKVDDLTYSSPRETVVECKILDGVKVQCLSDEEKEAAESASREAAEAKMKLISITCDLEKYHNLN